MAIDVQKTQNNCGSNFSRNVERTDTTSGIQVGDAVSYQGNTYICVAQGGGVSGGSSQAGQAPVHTSCLLYTSPSPRDS